MSESPLARFWLKAEGREEPEGPVENIEDPQGAVDKDDPSPTPDISVEDRSGGLFRGGVEEPALLELCVSLRGQATIKAPLLVDADDLLDALGVAQDRGWLVGVDARTSKARAYCLDDVVLIEES